MPEEPQAGQVQDALPALKELHEQVNTAVREIHRLRHENKELRARIRQLEERPEVEPDQAFVAFDEEPATLRRKVEGFIDTIDHYLDEDAPS